MVQMILLTCLQHTLDGFAPLQPHRQHTCLVHQLFDRWLGPVAFVQFVPKLGGFQQEWYIIGVLEIRLAKNTRMPVRTAFIMSRSEPINPQNAPAIECRESHRRAANASEPQNNAVVCFHDRQI